MDAILASEVACHRYAGDDQRIIERLGELYCDAAPSARLSARVNLPDSVEPPIFAAMYRDRSVLEALVGGFRRLFGK